MAKCSIYCQDVRKREHVRKGRITNTENETVWLITSLKNPDPNKVLALNRGHWGIEIMHLDKDVTLGEDQYTDRLDHAPRNIFTRRGAARTVLKGISKSPTRAIEIVQDTETKRYASWLTKNSDFFQPPCLRHISPLGWEHILLIGQHIRRKMKTKFS